ncbi:PREDICTED: uncharacterized protein LOC18596586 [Theobroma cacao]|uniref:Uncharacterized protein LOC18596586 n=2 Tax=Theobroma cacao TaxID=3641 RepID=A0AB32WKR9_THECC|nr:PREDICTED: uncharacterized protein LOC18596586 [Theobroma cacao]EOY27848.1 Uncharacterized protein TCM_029583 [Theobroma cacao]
MESSILSLLILFAIPAPKTPQSKPPRHYNLPARTTRDQMMIRVTNHNVMQQRPPLPNPEPILLELAQFRSTTFSTSPGKKLFRCETRPWFENVVLPSSFLMVSNFC